MKKSKKILMVLIAMAAFMMQVAEPASAYNEKRARRRMVRLKAEYPHVLASFCDVKEKETNTIQYLPGKRDTLWQAEYIDCDTVIGEDRIVKVPYPVPVPVIDSVIVNNTKIIENRGLEHVYKDSMVIYRTQKTIYKQEQKSIAVIAMMAGAGIMFFILTLIKAYTK